MTDYYDAVLALIPLTVCVVTAALVGAGVGLPVAVSAGSLLSVGIMGHAMFVRAPLGGTGATTAPATETPDGAARSNQPVPAAD
jgi:hypothetical protein